MVRPSPAPSSGLAPRPGVKTPGGKVELAAADAQGPQTAHDRGAYRPGSPPRDVPGGAGVAARGRRRLEGDALEP
jgi:hypothetical protein